MALARIGMPFSDVSGNLCGVNVRRVGGTHVIGQRRGRGSMRTMETDSSAANLANMRTVWLGLTTTQRAGWQQYAMGHARRDRVGNMKVRPAYEWFQRWFKYASLTVAGQPNVHYEPPYEDRPSFPCGSMSLDFEMTPTYEITLSQGLMLFGFSKLEIWASRMAREGVVYAKDVRFIGFKTFVAYRADVTTLFTAKGITLVEGETIFVKARWAIFKHWPGPWSVATTKAYVA